MVMIPIILLGVVCLAMSVIYAIFKDKGEWQGFIVRSLTSLFLLIYAVITINLTSTINAFSLFIAISVAISMFYEALQTSKISNVQAKIMIGGLSKACMYLALALSVMSLAEFNLLSLIGGLLFGIALGLLVWAIKKYKNIAEILSTIFVFLAIGLAVGFGINSFLTTKHLISTIVTIVATLFLLVSEIINHFMKEGKGKAIISSLLKNIALIMFVVSIYLFS